MATIFVVDDDPSMRDLLDRRLTSEGYEVSTFSTSDDVIRAIAIRPPDLVLMDVAMPNVDGYESCRRLKADFPNVPVVFVSASGDLDSKMTAFEVGGRDYIAKPFAAAELLARVRATLREKAMLDTAQRRSEILHQLAVIDALTVVANRRYLEARFPEELARARRYARPLSCMMVDVDDFKQINDTQGHAVGDAVIAAVAKIIRSDVREVDFVARYGGEEFVVVLPETPSEGVLIAAARLCDRVAASPIEGIRVTVSIGIATGHEADVLVRADTAMYAAKRAGKNRVHLAEG